MTIREVAAIAGVSPAAISIVLNGKKGVSETTRAHVMKVLEETSYNKKKATARTARKHIVFLKYRTHGMAVEENQGFIASIVDHIEAECRRLQYDFTMQICTAETIEDVLTSTAATVDGIVLLGTELCPESYSMLQQAGKPLVVLDNSMSNLPIDSVVMANYEIASAATQYLYDLGHREIGYFQTNIEVSNLKERYEGYKSRMKTLGIPRPEPIYVPPTLNGAYTTMKKLLETGFTIKPGGYFAENDSIAIGVSRALTEAGYRIPQEISLMGVDDIPFSSVTAPTLTTMRVSRSALGILAIDVLRKRIKYPHWPTMRMQVLGTLVERESTAKV